MIAREICRELVSELREVPGVSRILLAYRDGVARYDDASLLDREAGAATVATLLGAASIAGGSFELGDPEGAIVYGAEVQLVIRPVGDELVLVAVAHLDASSRGIYRVMRATGRRIERELEEIRLGGVA